MGDGSRQGLRPPWRFGNSELKFHSAAPTASCAVRGDAILIDSRSEAARRQPSHTEGTPLTPSPHAARERILAIAAVLAVSLGAGAARADPPLGAPWLYERMATTPLERGHFYAGFTLWGGVQQLPRFNAGTSIFDGGTNAFVAPFPLDADVHGVQPGGEFGYVFRDGTFPGWMGSRVRAAVYGSAAFFERSQDRVTNIPVSGFGNYHDVNGQVVTNFFYNTPGTPTFNETLTVHREGFQAGLKMESDIALGPNLALTPAIAVFGGQTTDRYTHTGIIDTDNPAVLFGFIQTQVDQRMRTREFGGHLGGRLTWQFQPGWALHFGGTAGPVWMRSRLSATDCFVPFALSLTAPCGPGNVGLGTHATTSASDSRSKLGFRGTASLGLSADMRYAILSIGGFMRYDSHIPGIANPQITSTSQFGQPVAPAQIRFDDGFAYGGFLTLRVPLL